VYEILVLRAVYILFWFTLLTPFSPRYYQSSSW